MHPRTSSIELPPWFADAHPTHTLKTVNVAVPDPQIVSWLTCPRADYQPAALSVDLTDSFRDRYGYFIFGLASILEPSVSALRSLALQTGFYTSTHKACNAWLIEKASVVEDLVLRFDAHRPEYFELMLADIDGMLKAVSVSTKRLCLLFNLPFKMDDTLSAECMCKLDAAIIRLLPKLDRLSDLTVIVDHGPFGNKYVPLVYLIIKCKET